MSNHSVVHLILYVNYTLMKTLKVIIRLLAQYLAHNVFSGYVLDICQKGCRMESGGRNFEQYKQRQGESSTILRIKRLDHIG